MNLSKRVKWTIMISNSKRVAPWWIAPSKWPNQGNTASKLQGLFATFTEWNILKGADTSSVHFLNIITNKLESNRRESRPNRGHLERPITNQVDSRTCRRSGYRGSEVHLRWAHLLSNLRNTHSGSSGFGCVLRGLRNGHLFGRMPQAPHGNAEWVHLSS